MARYRAKSIHCDRNCRLPSNNGNKIVKFEFLFCQVRTRTGSFNGHICLQCNQSLACLPVPSLTQPHTVPVGSKVAQFGSTLALVAATLISIAPAETSDNNGVAPTKGTSTHILFWCANLHAWRFATGFGHRALLPVTYVSNPAPVTLTPRPQRTPVQGLPPESTLNAGEKL